MAAFFAEPVMGAGGAIIPPKTYFEKVQAVLRKHDVLFIADEVICGFGRTGNWWGSQTFKLQARHADLRQGAVGRLSADLRGADQREDAPGDAGPERQARQLRARLYAIRGHPVTTAVALEVLKIYEEMDINARARRLGRRMLDGLSASPVILWSATWPASA